MLHLDAYRHGAVVSRPARLLRVPIRLPEKRPPTALSSIAEVIVPAGALANVRRHTLPSVIAVLALGRG